MKKIIDFLIVVIIITILFPYALTLIEYTLTSEIEFADVLVAPIPIVWIFICLIISFFIWIKPIRDMIKVFMENIELKKNYKGIFIIAVFIFSFILKRILDNAGIIGYEIKISILYVIVILALLIVLKKQLKDNL